MSGSNSSTPQRPRLSKSHTLPAGSLGQSGARGVIPDAAPNSAQKTSGRHAMSDKQLPAPSGSTQQDQNHSSILSEEGFGQQYAYGAAESAVEPWRMAAAIGKDVGQFVLGRLGWKPSSAVPEQNEEMFQHECCSYVKARLKRQAEEWAEKEGAGKEEKEEQAKEDAQKAVEPDFTDGSSRQGAAPDPHSSAALDSQKLQLPGSDGSSSSSSGNQSLEEPGQDGGKQHEHELNRVSTISSTVSGDITISGTGHYDPKDDVILRLETMSAAEVRFTMLALWGWLTVALGFLIYEFVRKLYDANAALKSFNTPIMNVVLGGICFVCVTCAICCHCHRLYLTKKHGKVWKPRRKKYTVSITIELVAQWINLVFFLIPNIESFSARCFRIRSAERIGYYSLVRWTCWNTLFLLSLCHAHNTNHISREAAMSSSAGRRSLDGRSKLQSSERVREDVAVMDLPFWEAHKWKLAYWLLTECTLIAAIVHYIVTVGEGNADVARESAAYSGPCGSQAFACYVSKTTLGLVGLMVFFILVYFVLYCFYIARSFHQLKKKSNTAYKIANVIVRLQMRLRLPAFAFFMLSLILLWFTKPFSCNSLVDTWWGMLPGQLAATVSVLLLAFIGTPKSIGGHKPILQVWLQEFAWTEAEKPQKYKRRNASLPPAERESLEKEPMFCVETMMHCLYWSLLVYDYREVGDSKLSIEEACGLFNPPLDEFEVFWEKSLDTKMLLAWNKERMVLAFRGTASLANVAADLQAWRSVHQPKRGHWWGRPMVHSGFDKAWRNNGFNERVVSRIEEILSSGQVDKHRFKFHVTGHSLGGALATLAAYDMRALGRKYGKDCKVSCYTFGAPRTGNHAFARDFEELVPDCWHIINDQDVVARGAKFWVLYKRGGHRVLINPLGDLIVRPNAIEASMRLVPCSGSVQQHLLTSYLKSLLSVLLAQFSSKRIHGGMTGVVQLAKENTAIKRVLLEEAGMEYKDLVYLSRWGAYAPKVAQKADLDFNVRRSSNLAKDKRDRRLPGPQEPTTRGGFLVSCCASQSLKVKEAKGDPHSTAADASVLDGGDVQGDTKV